MAFSSIRLPSELVVATETSEAVKTSKRRPSFGIKFTDVEYGKYLTSPGWNINTTRCLLDLVGTFGLNWNEVGIELNKQTTDSFFAKPDICKKRYASLLNYHFQKRSAAEKSKSEEELNRKRKRCAGMANGGKKKRLRRTAAEIERKHKCPVSSCKKAYGTDGALKMHLRLKHPSFNSANLSCPYVLLPLKARATQNPKIAPYIKPNFSPAFSDICSGTDLEVDPYNGGYSPDSMQSTEDFFNILQSLDSFDSSLAETPVQDEQICSPHGYQRCTSRSSVVTDQHLIGTSSSAQQEEIFVFSMELLSLAMGSWISNSLDVGTATFDLSQQIFDWNIIPFSGDALLVRIPFNTVTHISFKHNTDGTSTFSLGMSQEPSFYRNVRANWMPCSLAPGVFDTHSILVPTAKFCHALEALQRYNPRFKEMLQSYKSYNVSHDKPYNVIYDKPYNVIAGSQHYPVQDHKSLPDIPANFGLEPMPANDYFGLSSHFVK